MGDLEVGILIALLFSIVGFIGLLFYSDHLEDRLITHDEFIQKGVDNGHLIYHPQTSELTFTTCEDK